MYSDCRPASETMPYNLLLNNTLVSICPPPPPAHRPPSISRRKCLWPFVVRITPLFQSNLPFRPAGCLLLYFPLCAPSLVWAPLGRICSSLWAQSVLRWCSRFPYCCLTSTFDRCLTTKAGVCWKPETFRCFHFSLWTCLIRFFSWDKYGLKIVSSYSKPWLQTILVPI